MRWKFFESLSSTFAMMSGAGLAFTCMEPSTSNLVITGTFMVLTVITHLARGEKQVD
ncbi:hypothetical protein BI004_gp216 [Bacillus phage NotTheCreek]|uniref:Uncharacterized protein n=1 Tax=Bacillus phage PPIsBest TaxID=2024234 RepID=A0A222Z2K1_9CAUD|nr:hypothetical protein BIZ89_gp221 [Bacillus phage Kida]YP_009284544.1 hypothetical protein BI004_gp216 [Bacillus phage NotTheCreek]AMW63435.1 hypothetical protein NOTTHECREEK_216 [Bacillus phage NotTheCreek]ANU79842.1 hypothetical protein KIDA_223 [Bacillus phage Kida]ASR78187.1 hypothetical protein PPISBEST_218 [Bacillus phage PPIsBest]